MKVGTIKKGDYVRVWAGLEGLPDEVYQVIRGRNGKLILDDDMGTRLDELRPEAVHKVKEETNEINNMQGV